MAAPVIKFKRGANSSLPALKAGEPAFVTDEFDFYIGLTMMPIIINFSDRIGTGQEKLTLLVLR